MTDPRERTYRTMPGEAFYDWCRGWRQVDQIDRGEDIHRYCDGRYYRGSAAERCALHGGNTRPQAFDVRD